MLNSPAVKSHSSSEISHKHSFRKYLYISAIMASQASNLTNHRRFGGGPFARRRFSGLSRRYDPYIFGTRLTGVFVSSNIVALMYTTQRPTFVLQAAASLVNSAIVIHMESINRIMLTVVAPSGDSSVEQSCKVGFLVTSVKTMSLRNICISGPVTWFLDFERCSQSLTGRPVIFDILHYRLRRVVDTGAIFRESMEHVSFSCCIVLVHLTRKLVADANVQCWRFMPAAQLESRQNGRGPSFTIHRLVGSHIPCKMSPSRIRRA